MKLFFATALLWSSFSFGQVPYSLDTLLMGSSFTFTAISEDITLSKKAVQKGIEEVVRIESLISSWDINSETSLINKNAGFKPTKVSFELYELIRRSKRISKLSNGAFDISFASIDNIWDFKSKSVELPTDEQIKESIVHIDFQKIELSLNDTSVFLKDKGMKIGFGGIGKGYAADQAKKIMVALGIKSGVVNAGGDLTAWGNKVDGKNWEIGIQDPEAKKNIILSLPISNKSVVTSGNYERFIEINGEKYCHIIDPETGWPVKNLKSVTIICKNTELADALATTVFVLGTQKGLQLINQLKQIEAIIIDENSETHYSDNISSNLDPYEN